MTNIAFESLKRLSFFTDYGQGIGDVKSCSEISVSTSAVKRWFGYFYV